MKGAEWARPAMLREVKWRPTKQCMMSDASSRALDPIYSCIQKGKVLGVFADGSRDGLQSTAKYALQVFVTGQEARVRRQPENHPKAGPDCTDERRRTGESLSIHHSSAELYSKDPQSNNQTEGSFRLAIGKCNMRWRTPPLSRSISRPPKRDHVPLSFIHFWSYQCYTWTDPLWNMSNLLRAPAE